MSGPMAVVHPIHQNTSVRMTSSPEGGTTVVVSRLQQMQARFQQKQQQEKEQKLLALYADQAQQAYAKINNGGGKVRQLFQERRGLDRSYPLQPLQGRRGTSLDRGLQVRQNTRKNHVRVTPPRYPSAGYEGDNDFYYQPIFTSQTRLDQEFNENNNKNIKQKQQQQKFADENDHVILPKSYDLDSTKLFKKLPNIGGATLTEQKAIMAPAKEQEIKKPSITSQNRTNKNPTNSSTDTAVKSLTKTMAKLTPPSKKPEVKTAQNSDSKSRVGVRRPTPVPTSNNVISRPLSGLTDKEKPKDEVKMSTKPPGRVTPKVSRQGPPTGGAQNLDLSPCSICGRNFASDRLPAHEVICAKTSKKKRKPFDPIKQRLTGTGAEKYLKKGKPAPPPTSLKKSNWRKKHEEFINNIRAAKQAQAHVAAGGKLADLPPPPPLDTSDYIQCPHCNRKFNQAAADRHIPKCATMLHNKPKPGANGGSRTQAARKK